MTAEVMCPTCSDTYSVDAGLVGKRVRCKRCGELMTVPRPVAAPPVPTSPAPISQSVTEQAPPRPQLKDDDKRCRELLKVADRIHTPVLVVGILMVGVGALIAGSSPNELFSGFAVLVGGLLAIAQGSLLLAGVRVFVGMARDIRSVRENLTERN